MLLQSILHRFRNFLRPRTSFRPQTKNVKNEMGDGAHLPLFPESLGLLGEVLSALFRYRRQVQPDHAETGRRREGGHLFGQYGMLRTQQVLGEAAGYDSFMTDDDRWPVQ